MAERFEERSKRQFSLRRVEQLLIAAYVKDEGERIISSWKGYLSSGTDVDAMSHPNLTSLDPVLGWLGGRRRN